MTDIRTMMAYGLDGGSAEMVAGIPARLNGLGGAELAAEKTEATEDLMRLGMHAQLATVVVNNGTVPEMMHLGFQADLAEAVKAVVNV